jgi:hypothetical protein
VPANSNTSTTTKTNPIIAYVGIRVLGPLLHVLAVAIWFQ